MIRATDQTIDTAPLEEQITMEEKEEEPSYNKEALVTFMVFLSSSCPEKKRKFTYVGVIT